jgi:hypothetical protein
LLSKLSVCLWIFRHDAFLRSHTFSIAIRFRNVLDRARIAAACRSMLARLLYRNALATSAPGYFDHSVPLHSHGCAAL